MGRVSGRVTRTGAQEYAVKELLNRAFTPALRPSLPQRAGSGHLLKATLTGRFADLDLHALASGLRYSRATDEEACGAGSVKGSSFSRIHTSSGLDAHQLHAGYTSRPFRIALSPWPDTILYGDRYEPAPTLIPTAFLPDTFTRRSCLCSHAYPFVRPYPRRPAYALSIRSAISPAAGGWLRPLDPRKGQRQKDCGHGKQGLHFTDVRLVVVISHAHILRGQAVFRIGNREF